MRVCYAKIQNFSKSIKFKPELSRIMRIAITKLQEKSEGIQELFMQFGHEPVIVSTMQADEPTATEPLMLLSDMISKNEIDILIFTSALGVDRLFEKIRPGKNVRIVSVGPKTAKRVEEYGLSSEVIGFFSSENFANHLGDIGGKTIGIARAEVPNPELIESLARRGGRIVEAPVYSLKPSGNNVLNVLNGVDAVIFTSARSFLASGFTPGDAKKLKTIAIGLKTSEAMRKSGIYPEITGNGTIESCLSLLNKRVADACK
jgi:uroporphyrinogen-III synthase